MHATPRDSTAMSWTASLAADVRAASRTEAVSSSRSLVCQSLCPSLALCHWTSCVCHFAAVHSPPHAPECIASHRAQGTVGDSPQTKCMRAVHQSGSIQSAVQTQPPLATHATCTHIPTSGEQSNDGTRKTFLLEHDQQDAETLETRNSQHSRMAIVGGVGGSRNPREPHGS